MCFVPSQATLSPQRTLPSILRHVRDSSDRRVKAICEEAEQALDPDNVAGDDFGPPSVSQSVGAALPLALPRRRALAEGRIDLASRKQPWSAMVILPQASGESIACFR
jgi:hypothetical protein